MDRTGISVGVLAYGDNANEVEADALIKGSQFLGLPVDRLALGSYAARLASGPQAPGRYVASIQVWIKREEGQP